MQILSSIFQDLVAHLKNFHCTLVCCSTPVEKQLLKEDIFLVICGGCISSKICKHQSEIFLYYKLIMVVFDIFFQLHHQLHLLSANSNKSAVTVARDTVYNRMQEFHKLCNACSSVSFQPIVSSQHLYKINVLMDISV